MLELKVSNETLISARKKAEEMGVLRNSITKGQGNVAGFIGEELSQKVYGGKLDNTYQHDLVLEDGRRVDVKTKRTSVEPQESYDCSVSASQIDYDCDGYVFVRIKNDFSTAWMLGYISKEAFKEKSVFHKKGDIDKSNGFMFRMDCYNIKIKDLEKP
jgi:hypothetical protein|tara:strand:- start:3456 stop:3929 length:474 start_codon:yes stop_codon:yes gene_type:complete